MNGRGLGGDVQAFGELAVGQSFGDERGDLALAWCQVAIDAADPAFETPQERFGAIPTPAIEDVPTSGDVRICGRFED